jgi:enoyl-CoA hydratase/carnithine racemase
MIASASPKAAIETVLQDGVLRIGICRPEKKNALSLAMYQALTEAMERADGEGAVRVILLHGTADCFTSGNDLQDFLARPPEGPQSPVFRFLTALSRAQKPIVAAVNGPAVGIGTTLLLHCDLVYAGEQASFQLPFVNLGLCPEAASSFLLPRLVGHPRAAELLLLGEAIPAGRALEMGLVNAVLADGQLLPHASAQARKLAEKPPASLRLTKQLLKAPQAEAVEQALRREADHFLHLLVQPEAREALNAFFERRSPDFSQFE